MTILIANIGTSDLAVKIEDYYLPIQFDRYQPNIDYSGLDEQQSDYWHNREYYLSAFVCEPLGVTFKEKVYGENKSYTYSFRDLTEALYLNYDTWRDKIIPSRILGVIDKAVKDFQVNQIYLFVTDQQIRHEKDSVYLFKILEKWLNDNNYNVKLFPKYIPQNIILNNESLDPLLDFYYSFFQDLINTYSTEEQLLISIKGGIPNMVTALKMQGMSAPMTKLLFIDPSLLIKNILEGNSSDCVVTSYWQYIRTQKYNTVKQLLERWDFDGCITILRDWNKTLTFLIDQNVLQRALIKEDRKKIELVIQALNAGLSAFNLDMSSTRNIIAKNQDLLTDNLVNFSQSINDNYSNLLNVYTQCRIYDQLGQTANMLSSMMSFYDVMLQTMIEKTGGRAYLTNDYKIKIQNFNIDIKDTLFQEFKTLEGNIYGNLHSIKINRFSKRNYVDILVKHRHQNRNINNEIIDWRKTEYKLQNENNVSGILGLLKSLEYWAETRNYIIHNADGISPARLKEANNERPDGACSYDEILWIMETIIKSPLIALEQNYKREFVGTDKYYLYSDIKQWVINKLIYQSN